MTGRWSHSDDDAIEKAAGDQVYGDEHRDVRTVDEP
jgi:hypothetical protein